MTSDDEIMSDNDNNKIQRELLDNDIEIINIYCGDVSMCAYYHSRLIAIIGEHGIDEIPLWAAKDEFKVHNKASCFVFISIIKNIDHNTINIYQVQKAAGDENIEVITIPIDDMLPMFLGSGGLALKAAYYTSKRYLHYHRNPRYKENELDYLDRIKLIFEVAAGIITSMNGLKKMEVMELPDEK